MLIDALAKYLHQAIAKGAAAIAIATEAHTKALESRLRADGVDIDQVRRSEQLILLDAEQTLATFMVDGTPDRERFFAQVGSIVSTAAHGRRHVFAFGEMVALLWKEDQTAAAVELEQLWNELARQQSFTLFCAYPIQDCGGDHHVVPFAAVCASHTRVIPIGELDASLSQEHQRQIAQLQQKEQLLERKLDQEMETQALLQQQESALSRAHLELQSRTSELVRLNEATIGREMRIIELKGEVNALREELGQNAPYALQFDQDAHGLMAVASEPQDCQEGPVSLESVLRTAKLRERPSRPPDHATENRVLTALMQALSDAPRTILQTLAEKTLEVLQAGSAGLSLLTKDGKSFYWAAIAGQWSAHLGGGTPRGFGPCGDVLDRDAPLLFTHWQRRYPYLAQAVPLAEEGLLVPFHVDGHAVGTIWAIAHAATRQFDAEDLRQLESLARFASAAYQARDMLEERRAALNLLEDAMQSKAIAEESSRKSRQDQEALRRREQWLAGQRDAFQAAINGAPLDTSLGILIRAAIARSDAQLRCAFYIANTERTELHHVSGMTESYAKVVDRFRIAADSLSCGLAVYTGKPVLTPDVTTEPLWEGWRWLAAQHEFRACWSFPVETETGKVIGTLAMYYKEPREPTTDDLNFAAALTQSAAIIISRHQEAGERLRARRELESAARHKDDFLAMLSHELRNPLAPIRNAGEVLARTLPPDCDGQVAVGMINRQVKQLTQLVDDLLDVARITQGRIELSRCPIELASVVEQAIETAEPQVRERRHTLSVTSTNYESLCVNGDLVRLVQCVANLLTNAAKYTDPDGEIWVRTRADGDKAVIEVRDSGVGIPAELLPRIFDLFVQSDRTLDRAQGGLGIGLSVVKRLVEMHGGEVSARSAGLGQGSSFEIRLPRIAAERTTSSEAAEPKVTPRRVLVVDDNVDSAQSLAMLLNLQGHETRVAFSAKQALELVGRFRPEIALIDLGLPEMDGYGLAERLRTLPELRSTRLMAVTGYGQAEDRRRTQAAGFD
ncbi:MAG: GAF domain-containing protein, partial [Acetobacteraceae bacterium]